MPDHVDALQAELPAGFTARPFRMDDVPVVAALIADCERHDDGSPLIDASDVAAVWSQPTMDLATMSIAVFSGETLVAGGEVADGRAELDVHPAWRGRGIGSALMRWSWDRARAQGKREVGQSISNNRRDAAAMFAAHGYRERWTSWVLSIDVAAKPAPPALPDGYTLRDFVPGDDDRAAHDVIERAFNEWPDRDPSPFENWRALTVASESFAAWGSPVLMAGDRMAGVAIGFDYGPDNEGWTHALAVDARDRGLGLGKALLTESFRRFWDAGRRRCGLSTDSRTGALSLYEHVGMGVRRSYTRWSKTL